MTSFLTHASQMYNELEAQDNFVKPNAEFAASWSPEEPKPAAPAAPEAPTQTLADIRKEGE